MTITTNKNSNNDWILTLRENSTLWSQSGVTPYYLFSITSDTTNQVINFVADNISPFSAQSRYDEFTIIETGSTFTNLTAGTINLQPETYWTLHVYEQTTRNNLDITQTVGLVEVDKVRVNGVIEAPLTYYSPTGNTGYYTYSQTH